MKRYAIVILFSVLAACGAKTSYVQKARTTVSVTHEAVKAADAGFLSWDKQHQLELVSQSESREEAEAKLTAYRAKREPIVKAFAIAYSSIAAAAAVIPLVEKGINPETELVDLLADALKASIEVKAAIDQLRRE